MTPEQIFDQVRADSFGPTDNLPVPCVVVGVPSYGDVPPQTVASLIGLICRAGPFCAELIMEGYLYVDRARNEIVRKALGYASRTPFINPQGDPKLWTHLLWLDADMTWPSDTVQRLLEHRKPVVSGLYFARHAPYPPVVWEWGEREETVPWDRLRGDGLQKVGGVGLGCCLMELDVFRRMYDEDGQVRHGVGNHRWFSSRDDGEDVHFFRNLRRIGVDCWLDPTVRCGHLQRDVITQNHHDLYRRMAEGEIRVSH